jgi:hypothetical protein
MTPIAQIAHETTPNASAAVRTIRMKTHRAPFRLTLTAACAALLMLGTIPTPAGAQSPGMPVATPAATPPPAPSGPAAQIDAFARAWASVTAYSAVVTVFEQRDTQVQNVVFNYSFRKPASATVHIAAGPNAGATLTWDGGADVVARRGSGIFAALFKKTMSLHDPQVTTIRGSSIDQLSFGAILAHGQQTPGTLSQGPGDVINGVATDAVTLIHADPAADAGLTREVIELSTATHFPMRILGYDGPMLVRKIEFSNVELAG